MIALYSQTFYSDGTRNIRNSIQQNKCSLALPNMKFNCSPHSLEISSISGKETDQSKFILVCAVEWIQYCIYLQPLRGFKEVSQCTNRAHSGTKNISTHEGSIITCIEIAYLMIQYTPKMLQRNVSEAWLLTHDYKLELKNIYLSRI